MANNLTQKPGKRVLSDAEKMRLEQCAPWFDIEFLRTCDQQYLLRVSEAGAIRESIVPEAVAYTRLLAEVCSKTLPWVYFSTGNTAADALFANSDAKLRRIAELYARAKKTGKSN